MTAAGAGAPGDIDTRRKVLQVLLENTCVTASEIAEQLDLTGAAVRRHLHQLDASGYAEKAAPTGKKPSAGRGRPASAWRITPAGRNQFGHSYDELARQALVALRQIGGHDAVVEFARRRAEAVLAVPKYLCASHGRHSTGGDDDAAAHPTEIPLGFPLAGPGGTGSFGAAGDADTSATAQQMPLPQLSDADAVHLLVQAFRRSGYAVTVEHAGGGVQLCQHHCPVAQVARDFPELCDAEAHVIAEIMGRPVQTLATIPDGNGVCTTNIPPPPDSS